MPGLSSFFLRILALLATACDYAGLAMLPRHPSLRLVGRLAFPIFCFLLVQGFVHTRDRRHYALRLLALALLCEIPFDILHFGIPFAPIEQNAVFSLLLSLETLEILRRLRGTWLTIPAIPAAGAAAILLGVSFGWLGPVLCAAFYLCRKERMHLILAAVLLPLLYGMSLFILWPGESFAQLSLASPLCAIPIGLYNGKPGRSGNLLHIVSYAAPLLLLLAAIILRSAHLIPPWM